MKNNISGYIGKIKRCDWTERRDWPPRYIINKIKIQNKYKFWTIGLPINKITHVKRKQIKKEDFTVFKRVKMGLKGGLW